MATKPSAGETTSFPAKSSVPAAAAESSIAPDEKQIMQINELQTVTKEVIEAARGNLVIGQA